MTLQRFLVLGSGFGLRVSNLRGVVARGPWSRTGHRVSGFGVSGFGVSGFGVSGFGCRTFGFGLEFQGLQGLLALQACGFLPSTLSPQ